MRLPSSRQAKGYLPAGCNASLLQEPLARLQADYGIDITAEGKVAKGKEPRLDLATMSRPFTGMTGELTRALQAKQYDQYIEEMTANEAWWRDCAKCHQKAKRTRAMTAAHAVADAHQRDLARLRSARLGST